MLDFPGVAESIGIFDAVENVVYEGLCVELVRGKPEQVTLGGVVESENLFGKANLAFFGKLDDDASHFVVHADERELLVVLVPRDER